MLRQNEHSIELNTCEERSVDISSIAVDFDMKLTSFRENVALYVNI